VPCGSLCSGSADFAPNVASAALSAAATARDPTLDFSEESAGDAGFDGTGGVERDRNIERDELFIPCQIGDHRVKGKCAEVFPEFGQVAGLERPRPFEPRHEVSEQRQLLVVALLHVFDGTGDLDDALRSPVGGFQRDYDELGGTKCRETHERQSGWTIKENVVVCVLKIRDGIDEREMQVGSFPRLLVGQIERRERRPCGEDVDMGEFGLLNEIVRIGVGTRMKQRLDTGCLISFRKEAAGQVALCVGVDRQSTTCPRLFRKGRRKSPTCSAPCRD